MRGKYWVFVITVALTLVAADVFYWRALTERLRTGYQHWLAIRVAQGWKVKSGPLSIGGWPRAATLTIPNLTLRHAGPAVPGDLKMAFTATTLSVPVFTPTDLRVSFAGPANVRIGDRPDVIVNAGKAALSTPLQQAEPRPVVLSASRVRLAASGGAWHLTVGSIRARAYPKATGSVAAGQPRAAVTFALGVDAIILPATVRWPLGRDIASFSLDGMLNGPLPDGGDTDPNGIAPNGITQSAAAWRDGGGSLKITGLTMHWGKFRLTGSATLALDAQLQPAGSGSARIEDYTAPLDQLAAEHMLSGSAATAVKAILSLLAGPGDGGRSVDVPLILQYRTLSMSRVPLLRLPELDWPPR